MSGRGSYRYDGPRGGGHRNEFYDNEGGRRGGRGRGRGRGRYDGYYQTQREVPVNYQPNWTEQTETFEEMGLNDELIHGLYSYGFKNPSEIQKLAITPILKRRHVLAQAQSGTGKTGAFSIGILGNIDISSNTTQALILAPTRELTQQIYQFILEISIRLQGLKVVMLRGGQNQGYDMSAAAERPHIAVCTPGRAMSLIESGHLRCEDLTMVCLDEADQMLDDRFLDQIQEIFAYFPPSSVQFLLFSATYPPSTFEIVDQFMPDPIRILVEQEQLTLAGISQYFVNVGDSTYKWSTLFDLYGALSIQKAIIFANSKQTVDQLQKLFTEGGFTVAAIHAGLEQVERDRIMKDFRLGKSRVLVSTDLLARGIDVQQITLVINYELPFRPEQYIHRIGRSGRLGRKGVAINLCDTNDITIINELIDFYHTQINELPADIADIINEANKDNGMTPQQKDEDAPQ